LAQQLRLIETQLGRQRHFRWDARNIDLDLLLYGNLSIETPDLQIPHPRMAFRRFVLVPACEIAAEMIHPTSGWTLAALRRHWQTLPRSVSVESSDRQLAAWLTTELQKHLTALARDQPNSPMIELLETNRSSTMSIRLDKHSPPHGPAVCIDSTDRQIILQEALAAIAAAWTE
jgi:hypothetical protein